MGKEEKIRERMKTAPQNVTYDELFTICVDVFGPARQNSGSHAKFQTPWPGPRINIQSGKGGKGGKAKQYQVEQVLAAIERMEGEGQ